MKVYVIMGNDFPECVFADKNEADTYVKAKAAEDAKARADRTRAGPPIYWRSYEFELK